MLISGRCDLHPEFLPLSSCWRRFGLPAAGWAEDANGSVITVNPTPLTLQPAQEVAPPAVPPLVVASPAPQAPQTPAQSWSDTGPRVYGKNYQVYIPMETKSNNPEVPLAWDASGYPRNGSGLTPQGDACATDADCRPPLGCFARADSGELPVKLCAFPPPY